MKDNVDEIKCPKCMSQNIHSGKKGFSTGKAIAGTIIANPVVGAITGTHRSNKIVLTCLKCGHQFKPGEQFKTKPVPKKLPDGVNVNKTELDKSYSITCSYCGKMSSTSFRACPKCGRHFLPEEKAAAKQTALEGGNKPTKVGCLGIVILFIATSAILILCSFQ